MKKKFDSWLFLPACFLMGYGIIMIFSASAPTAALEEACNYDSLFFLKRHLIWLTIGLAAMILAYKADLNKLRKFAIPILFVAAALLVIVLFPAFSVEILGARRSIALGPFTFQPSEFAKIALIFYLADALARRKDKIDRFTTILSPIAVLGLIVLLIEKQPDLGSTVVIGGSFLGMLFISGANVWHLACLTVVGFGVAAFRIMNEAYRVKRILAFLDPWKDAQETGYQIIQSFIALGSGGLFGLGLGESRQKYFYLPEKFTDFIFAITGEELGLLFGTLPIIILFLFLMYRGLRVAANTRDSFMSLLAGGLTFQIVLQAFINMGVVSGILPCTGIPLPFVSFGGSSLVFTLTAMGLILNVAGQTERKGSMRTSAETSSRPRFSDSVASTSSESINIKDAENFNRILKPKRNPRPVKNKLPKKNDGEKNCELSSREAEPEAIFTLR